MNFFKFLPETFRQKIIENLKLVRRGLAQESIETQQMLKVYFHFTQGRASAKEMEAANEQFRELLKTLGLGTLAVLPFSPITLPLAVKLGKKLGVDIIPSSFKDDSDKS